MQVHVGESYQKDINVICIRKDSPRLHASSSPIPGYEYGLLENVSVLIIYLCRKKKTNSDDEKRNHRLLGWVAQSSGKLTHKP